MNGVITGTTLSSFELFERFDQQLRNDWAEKFKQKKLVKGQYVISEFQSNNDVYFIISGKVHACAFAKNGKQVQFDELSSGMMFGELAALDGEERSSDCIAASAVSLAVLSADDFHDLIDRNKPARDFVIQRLAFLVRKHMRMLFELSSFPVRQRIRFELLRIASSHGSTQELVDGDVSIKILSNITHAEIASRIGTHREAVTKELKLLESLGVLTWQAGEKVIHDVSQLTSDVVLSKKRK